MFLNKISPLEINHRNSHNSWKSELCTNYMKGCPWYYLEHLISIVLSIFTDFVDRCKQLCALWKDLVEQTVDFICFWKSCVRSRCNDDRCIKIMARKCRARYCLVFYASKLNARRRCRRWQWRWQRRCASSQGKCADGRVWPSAAPPPCCSVLHSRKFNEPPAEFLQAYATVTLPESSCNHLHARSIGRSAHNRFDSVFEAN